MDTLGKVCRAGGGDRGGRGRDKWKSGGRSTADERRRERRGKEKQKRTEMNRFLGRASSYGGTNVGHMPRINDKGQCSTEGLIAERKIEK